MTREMVGARQNVAQQWAEQYNFPLGYADRANLPQVAQYVAIYSAESNLRNELKRVWSERVRHVRMEEQRRFGEIRSRAENAGETLNDLIRGLFEARWDREDEAYAKDGTPRTEPHRKLAALGLPIYVTTNYNMVLGHALERVGRTPKILAFPVRDRFIRGTASPTDVVASLGENESVVYHLYGNLENVGQIVLTEDDYFDFLAAFARHDSLAPSGVLKMLSSSSLLFLGFRMHHWDFRVLFRCLMSQEGRAALADHEHVAVQIDPNEDHFMDPDRAREYFEKYFGKSSIFLYWGSAEDFLTELEKS